MVITIQQYRLKLGTLFIVNYDYKDGDNIVNIDEWLKDNNIQHIFEYKRIGEYRYFIRDEASIMAFKLRWM